MLHFMDHAPFSEKWGKQTENVPNGGDWGYAFDISNLPKMPHSCLKMWQTDKKWGRFSEWGKLLKMGQTPGMGEIQQNEKSA